MLVLKEPCYDDREKLYEAIRKMPLFENGFENRFALMSYRQFCQTGITRMQDEGRGINLKPGHVPQSYFFLWADDTIVGLFKIRHYLNEVLREGSGHIGFGIIREFRNRHYGSMGLKLALEKAGEIVREDTVYMSCFRYNEASLKVMLANGAWIDHEDEEIYYTRVKIR
ncbi:MAG: GNAT family N-acetyltransferase [Erysipelotrichaceae bacterium]|nr:GNAT family N-acetyltransferase [Erysipelotrichaceae bacterium]